MRFFEVYIVPFAVGVAVASLALDFGCPLALALAAQALVQAPLMIRALWGAR